jgi:RES domain-containing protein
MGLVAGPIYDVALWWFRDLDGDPYGIEYDTDDVVAECADGVFTEDVAEEAVEAIAAAVATPTAWSSNAIQDEFAFNWDGFVQTVKHESRFVYLATRERGREYDPPSRVARFLEGLLAYADKETKMLVDLPVGTRLFRGRMTDDVAALRTQVDAAPAKEIGSPPPKVAQAGRMNAQGIPIFYSATTIHTAVAEIALHSPYDDAVVGEFVTQRDLTIIDFTRKPKLPSAFDRSRRERFMFARFVDDFVEAITQPVILDGRQRIDYVPTQIVTEYLRWVPDRRIEGIAFPSRVDRSGKNVVLFFGPGNEIRTDPLTREELEDRDLGLRVGGIESPALKIARNAITNHSVRRSVRVTSH